MIFKIISGGAKTDWVGKEWAGLFFPREKNGPAHSFPGEKTDWGKFRPVTPACVNGMKQTCMIVILAYFIYFHLNHPQHIA